MITAPLALIGYSGHAFVVYDIFTSQNQPVTAYCDTEPKSRNPFGLVYLGAETNANTLLALKNHLYFISIGNNAVRSRLYHYLCSTLQFAPVNAIHAQAYIAQQVQMGSGIMVGAKAVINPLATLGNGVICNTGAIIEHECTVADFAHIAPNATLCGNVSVGEGSFIGAGSVVKEGIVIGKNAVVGAGTVVVKNVPDGATVAGNPQRHL